MSLVDGINLEKNLIKKNKILNNKEIYEENISKEFGANYCNICIKLYLNNQNKKNIFINQK